MKRDTRAAALADLSVIVPTSEAAATLPRCVAALDGVGDVVVVDAASRDGSASLAEAAGAHVLTTPRGRGLQLSAGARSARGAWLLFLHADTVLSDGWQDEVAAFIANPDHVRQAACFRFAVDDASAAARHLERAVWARGRLFALPYGDQGLLISRRLYDEIGGYQPWPLMEDVDIIRRIGRRRLRFLTASAVTSADRYRRGGWVRRPLRNLCCLALYAAGLPPERIVRIYERS